MMDVTGGSSQAHGERTLFRFRDEQPAILRLPDAVDPKLGVPLFALGKPESYAPYPIPCPPGGNLLSSYDRLMTGRFWRHEEDIQRVDSK